MLLLPLEKERGNTLGERKMPTLRRTKGQKSKAVHLGPLPSPCRAGKNLREAIGSPSRKKERKVERDKNCETHHVRANLGKGEDVHAENVIA